MHFHILWEDSAPDSYSQYVKHLGVVLGQRTSGVHRVSLSWNWMTNDTFNLHWESTSSVLNILPLKLHLPSFCTAKVHICYLWTGKMRISFCRGYVKVRMFVVFRAIQEVLTQIYASPAICYVDLPGGEKMQLKCYSKHNSQAFGIRKWLYFCFIDQYLYTLIVTSGQNDKQKNTETLLSKPLALAFWKNTGWNDLTQFNMFRVSDWQHMTTCLFSSAVAYESVHI